MSNKMRMFTVIGIYEDTGQVFVESTEAEDQYQAMGIIGVIVDESEANLMIVGAYEGEQQFFTPGDDNGMTAYATDMRELAPTEH